MANSIGLSVLWAAAFNLLLQNDYDCVRPAAGDASGLPTPPSPTAAPPRFSPYSMVCTTSFPWPSFPSHP